jgi:hypothetical protein
MHHALVQPAVTDLKRKSIVEGMAAVTAQGAKFVVQTATMMVLARFCHRRILDCREWWSW